MVKKFGILLRRNWTSYVTRPPCIKICSQRSYSTPSSNEHIRQVPELNSWDVDNFREQAFFAAKPFRLPQQIGDLPPACQKWFIHKPPNNNDTFDRQPQSSELRTAFWSDHKSTLVPLELTSTEAEVGKAGSKTSFTRTEAPLKLLIAYLGNATSPTSAPLHAESSIYLAQCDLSSLPSSMQADLPTPDLVRSAGKGDVYSSSLWLGRPPTYTPLHRDPNPNLFLQLAGQKTVRLFPPEIGNAIFDQIQDELQEHTGPVAHSASIRGDEMMQGPERQLLHDAVWEDDVKYRDYISYAQEAHLSLGQALFIPKGWWHSVKGVGQGITASANWWFR